MKIEEINIPDSWCDLLKVAKDRDPNAIIAGGCIRDLFCGREFKDVDIFTAHMPDWEYIEASFDYEGMKYVQAVGTVPGDPERNVIQIDIGISNMDLLTSFDFGLCQIGFDGEKIIRTPAFDWDFKHNLFTMRNSDRYPRSVRRYSRFLPRYNMDIAIPKLDEKV